MQKKFYRHKNFGATKNIFDSRSPHKNYDQRKMLTHVKNILTHVTHANHVKILPTQPRQSWTYAPTLPRNPRDLVDSKKPLFWYILRILVNSKNQITLMRLSRDFDAPNNQKLKYYGI